MLGSPLRVQEQQVLLYLFILFVGDHPCVCRNNNCLPKGLKEELGSPLRVQEQQRAEERIERHTGITPACAGTTTIKSREELCIKDHPCVCRNNVGLWYELERACGITPACAGTTSLFFFPFVSRRDHPCVCRNNTNKLKQLA